jgi:hypothetical protein
MGTKTHSIRYFTQLPFLYLVIIGFITTFVFYLFTTPARTEEGFISPYINTMQYYCLMSLLVDISKKDPSMTDPFGILAISSLGIIDPAYTTIFDNNTMMVNDKLAAIMEATNTSIPNVLPPYIKNVVSLKYEIDPGRWISKDISGASTLPKK